MNTMITQAERLSKLDYFVATLFLACGGNQLLTGNTWYAFIVAAIMLIITARSTHQYFSNNLIKWELGFFLLAGLQIILLPKVSLPAYVNFAMKLYAGFLMVNYLGTRFRYTYFKVITFFAAISLILWGVYTITRFSIGIPVGQACKSLGIWAYYINEDVPRNQGMFWEPGAFQGYLMLVPILFIGQLKELWQTEKKSCVILIAALLSTTSTTGYIALMFIIGMYLLKGVRNIFMKVVLVAVFVFGSIYAINTFDFLGEKIREQFDASQSLDFTDSGVMQSRMGTMYIDWEIIQKHPFIGNSFENETKYGVYADIMSSSGNGLTGVVCTFGLPFFLIYLLAVYKRCSADKYFKIITVFTIMLIFYGENFIHYIPYWSLIFAIYDTDDIKILS